MIKEEIERRLKKPDIKRLPGLVGLIVPYANVTSEADKKKLLAIADINGSKYMQYYKVKEDIDILTLVHNLTTKTYTPNLDKDVNGIALKTASIQKEENAFSLLADFYTNDKEWVDVREGVREEQPVYRRRTVHLEKKNNSSFMILTIDPLGDGSRIGRDIPGIIQAISNENNVDFMDYFDIIRIDQAFYTLERSGILVAKNVKGREETTGRIKEITATSLTDNVSNDTIYTDITSGRARPEKIRYKFDKESVEMFDRSLMKIGTKINWSNTDELKSEIVSVL